MGIVQQASGTWTGTSFTPTLPGASTAANTVVVIVAGNTTVSTPGSWTLRTSQVNFMGHYLYDISGTSITSVAMTAVTGQGTWWIAETDGAYDGSQSQNNTANAGTYNTPNLTPTAGARNLYASIGSLAGASGAARTVSGWTNSFVEQADVCYSGTDFPMQGVAALTVAADGSTAYSTTATYSSSLSDGRTAIIGSYAGPTTSVTRVAVTTGAPAAVTAFSPTLPTHATGDRMILAVVGKDQTTTIPTIDQSWVLVGSGTGGTGSIAADTGQTFWAVYAKDATSSSETAPTVTPGGTAPNSWEWICATHRPAPGETWADSIGASAAWVQVASDTTTASPLTGTAGAWTGVQPTADDAIFAVGVIPTDLGTALGATTLTATGLTGGTKTTATSQYVENALGLDTAAVWAGWTGFTGTASAGLAVSFTVTGATNQSGSIIAIALRQQVGGTSYTQTPTDSAGLADTAAFDQTESVTDTTGLTDVAALTVGPTVTDSAGLTDTSLVQSGKVVDATDSAGLVDAAGLDRTLVVTDSAGLTDTTVSDRVSVLTDSAGLTDSASVASAGAGVFTDSAGLTDTLVLVRTLVYTDSAGLIDAPVLARSLVYTDSSGLTDTATVQAAKLLVVTDSAGLTDVGLTLNVAEDFTDLTGLTDTTSIAATGAAVYTDSAGLTDTRVFARSLGVTDSAGLTDTVSPALSGAGVFTDTAGLTDITAFIQSGIITDDAGLADARVLDLSKTQTDSVGLTDGTSISSGKILDFTDSSGLTDSATSSQAKSVTDDAGLTDTPTFAASKTLIDLAGLTDVALVIGQRDITITDSAGLTDTRVIGKGLEPTDSVGLTDSLAFAAAYRLTDSAGLVDTSLIDLQVPVVFGRGASSQGSAQTGSTGRALVASGRAGRG